MDWTASPPSRLRANIKMTRLLTGWEPFDADDRKKGTEASHNDGREINLGNHFREGITETLLLDESKQATTNHCSPSPGPVLCP